MTAWNPRSEPRSLDENRRANELLRRELRSGGHSFYGGHGKPDGSGWEPEESMLAIGVSREEALRLGRQFDQNAVVWGERGGRAELLDCRSSA